MTPSGTQAVIIGNGSSLDVMPPVFWEQDCLYIGTNRALCITSLQGVRLDAVVMRDTYRGLWKDPDVGWRFHKEIWKHSDVYKVGPSEMRSTHCDEFVRQVVGWQFAENRDRNHEAAVMKNASVVIMACNVAWHWGVRDFLVTGIDYKGRHARMLPGYEVSTGNEWRYDESKPVADCVERQFGEMRQAIESAGGSVWNCSPNSRLKALAFKEF